MSDRVTAPALRARTYLGALLAASALVAASDASAGGFAVNELSVKGLGRANSGEAAATGADALWWNPAAIARGPREVALGFHHRELSTDLDDNGSTITRPIPPAGLTTPVGGVGQLSDASADFDTPNVAIALPFGDRFAVGFSIVQPFRLEGEFGEDAWGRYDTIRNKIATTDYQLTGALKATDWLDVGVGVSAHRTKAALDTAYPNLSPLLPDAISHLEGDGWDYGWTVGAQAHLERLTLGASYRSAIEHNISGTLALSGLQAPLDGSNFSAPADTSLSTPWTVSLAGRFAVTPELTLNAQVVRSGWSEYDQILVEVGGGTEIIVQNYKDTTSIALGADYAVNEMWTVRGGVQFDPTPTPNELREPGVADSDRTVYAVGASAQVAPSLAIHGALAYVDFEGAELYEDAVFYGGTPAETTANLRGDFSGHALTVSVGANWGF
jgi:long-chain fatty acid transport protein